MIRRYSITDSFTPLTGSTVDDRVLKAEDKMNYQGVWYPLGLPTNRLYAWGYNYQGQLGLGDTKDRHPDNSFYPLL